MSEFSETDERLIQTMLHQRRISAEVPRRARVEDAAASVPSVGKSPEGSQGQGNPLPEFREALDTVAFALGRSLRLLDEIAEDIPDGGLCLRESVRDVRQGLDELKVRVASSKKLLVDVGKTRETLGQRMHDCLQTIDSLREQVELLGFSHDSSPSVGDSVRTLDPTEGEPSGVPLQLPVRSGGEQR